MQKQCTDRNTDKCSIVGYSLHRTSNVPFQQTARAMLHNISNPMHIHWMRTYIRKRCFSDNLHKFLSCLTQYEQKSVPFYIHLLTPLGAPCKWALPRSSHFVSPSLISVNGDDDDGDDGIDIMWEATKTVAEISRHSTTLSSAFRRWRRWLGGIAWLKQSLYFYSYILL